MVELTYLAIAGIALAAVFFGYGFGLFEGRGQGYKKRKKEESEEKAAAPAIEPVTVKVDDPGLLRIKNEQGAVALDLDGKRVDTAAMTPEQRRRLIEMLNLMRPWLEGKTASVPPSPVQSKPGDQPGQEAPAVSTTSSPPPVSKPSASRPAADPREERPLAPAGSIVSQIDTILQARLAGTALESRGIFLTQSPEGGVMVNVGLTKYAGIEEVPNPEIKAAIREAIREWENKYTPGL